MRRASVRPDDAAEAGGAELARALLPIPRDDERKAERKNDISNSAPHGKLDGERTSKDAVEAKDGNRSAEIGDPD